MLANFVSPYDATVVERLKAAGVVMLGKTNMDEFAMGSSNEPATSGRCATRGTSPACPADPPGVRQLPWQLDCVRRQRRPIRWLDSSARCLCGVTGLKPTYGRVSRYGMIAFASSLDQGGLITRSAEDAALLLEGMAGFDERDSTSVELPVPDYSASLAQPLKGLKVGCSRNSSTRAWTGTSNTRSAPRWRCCARKAP